jgi:hypothetical protein
MAFKKKKFDFGKKSSDRTVRRVFQREDGTRVYQKGLFNSFLKQTREELVSKAHSYSKDKINSVLKGKSPVNKEHFKTFQKRKSQ